MKKSVLIVEDEAMLALVLRNNFRLLGYDVCGPVATGEDAVAAALRCEPDAILMDIRLAGEMDGIEAAEIIAKKAAVPVIFVTGYTDETTRARARVINPAGFLVKPVTPDQILSVLDTIF